MNSPEILILGSSSPYRHMLLKRLGLEFTTHSPDIDEKPFLQEAVDATALRLATNKAKTVAKNNPQWNNSLIIGSDQLASCSGHTLSKPQNFDKALQQLQLMRGQEIIFYSALCLFNTHTQNTQTANIATYIKMRDVTDTELIAYLHKEQPYDCSGSLKVEELGITLLEYVHSDDPTALIGLPLIALTNMLRQEGVAFYDGLPADKTS